MEEITWYRGNQTHTIEWYYSGKYVPETRWEPAEYPELEYSVEGVDDITTEEHDAIRKAIDKETDELFTGDYPD